MKLDELYLLLLKKFIFKCEGTPLKNDMDQNGIMMHQIGSGMHSASSFSCEDLILEIVDLSKYYKIATMFFITYWGFWKNT